MVSDDTYAAALNQATANRRRVHPGLWRWLAVAEGIWGQTVAAMVAPESQEKPLQDELRQGFTVSTYLYSTYYDV